MYKKLMMWKYYKWGSLLRGVQNGIKERLRKNEIQFEEIKIII